MLLQFPSHRQLRFQIISLMVKQMGKISIRELILQLSIFFVILWPILFKYRNDGKEFGFEPKVEPVDDYSYGFGDHMRYDPSSEFLIFVHSFFFQISFTICLRPMLKALNVTRLYWSGISNTHLKHLSAPVVLFSLNVHVFFFLNLKTSSVEINFSFHLWITNEVIK